MGYPKTLEVLIDKLKLLPGIGEKTAERLAFAILDFSTEELNSFAKALINVEQNIKRCVECNHLTENEKCCICINKNRDNSVICVVEDPKSVILFERNNIFNGKYHVLNGLISPLNKVSPECININMLLERIENNNVKEVVIALKPTLEGETTSLYIIKLLEKQPVIVSRLACGIPVGADIDYLDALTLETAFSNRRKVS